MNHFYTVLIPTQGKITGINTRTKMSELLNASSLTELHLLGGLHAQRKRRFSLKILPNTYINSTRGKKVVIGSRVVNQL